MKIEDYQDIINEALLERGYEENGIDEFWADDSKYANGDGETIMDFIFKRFVNSTNSEEEK